MKLVKAASSFPLRGKRTNDETGTERISTVNRFFSQNGTRPATTVDTTSNDWNVALRKDSRGTQRSYLLSDTRHRRLKC